MLVVKPPSVHQGLHVLKQEQMYKIEPYFCWIEEGKKNPCCDDYSKYLSGDVHFHFCVFANSFKIFFL